MKSNNPVYYQFWIKSSHGTDKTTVRRYETGPDEITLRDDVEQWAKCFSCWSHAENNIDYGWKKIIELPMGRKNCLERYEKACEDKRKAFDKWRLYADLLAVSPFNE